MKDENFVRLFWGKSFTGKTSRMFYELRDDARVLAVDPKCGSLTKLEGWDHLWPFFDERTYLESKGKRCIWLGKTFIDYFRKRLKQKFRAMVHLRDYHTQQLNMLCGLMMGVKKCTVAVDELSIFVPPGPPSALPSLIRTLAISGRHESLRFYGTSQRLSFVHATIRGNASTQSFYRLTEENDLKAARGYLPRSIADSLPSLPDHVCVEWTDGGAPYRNESLVGKFLAPGEKRH